MGREFMEIRRNTDLVEKVERRIGGFDARGIEVGVLHDDGEIAMVRRETDGGSIGERIQKMKEGRSLTTESHPIDRDQDTMNQKRNIDLENGKNDDLRGTQMTQTRDDGIIESVMETEMIGTRIDEREGTLAVVVRLKDREKDTRESQLETNAVHHLQTHHPLALLITIKNRTTVLHPMTLSGISVIILTLPTRLVPQPKS